MKISKLSYRTFLKGICLTVFLGIAISGCAKKQTVEGNGEATGTPTVENQDVQSGRGDSDSNNAMGMKTVFFPFDSFEITGEAARTIKNNADILKSNPDVKIQIEGHCDERGGIQYNLALGEKRANAVKRKLTSMGVAANRIETVSYGKEKLIALGHTETDHSQNRRGNFVVTSK